MRNVKLMESVCGVPVTRDEVKLILRIDFNDDDMLIEKYIRTATDMCEKYCGRPFLNKTYKLVLDKFPNGYNNDYDSIEGKLSHDYNRKTTDIFVPYIPLVSVATVKYYTMANLLTTVSSAYYTVDTVNGRIFLNNGYSWGDFVTRELSSIEITFVAGYGTTPNDVPATIRTAIEHLAAALYESKGLCELSCDCKDMLNGFKIWDSLWLA